MRRTALLAGLSALALAIVGLAAPVQAATISGAVADDAAAPVGFSGVTIYAKYTFDDEEYWSYYTDVQSAGNGTYSVSGLPAGSYKVKFVAPSGSQLTAQYYEDRPDLASADVVVLATSQSTASNINAALHPGGAISGMVVTEDHGQPVSQTYVEVYNAAGDYVASTEADEDGAYRITNLPAGQYRIWFVPPSDSGYAREFYDNKRRLADADAITVVASEETDGIDASVRLGGSLAGRVTDESTGAGAPGIAVEVYDGDSFGGWAVTNADGEYTVKGLATGDHTVAFYSDYFGGGQGFKSEYYNNRNSFEDADPVRVTYGQTVNGIDAALDPGGRITGTVTTSAGQPFAGVQVELYDGTDPYYDRFATTDASGNYRLSGLSAGTYRIGFYDTSGLHRREYYDDVASLDSATAISVGTDALVEDIDASLAITGQVSGRVTAQDTGSPLAGVPVSIYTSFGFYASSTSTDGDGRYRAGGLESGTYRVSFGRTSSAIPAPPPAPNPPGTPPPTGPTGADYAGEYYDDEPSLADADAVTVVSGQVTPDIDAALTLGGRIDGTVVDAQTSTPIGNVNVIAYAADGYVIATTYTGTDGSYSIRGLRAGAYRLRFDGPYNGIYRSEYHDDKTSLAAADAVAVSAGQTTAVGTTGLAVGASISGRVSVEGGGTGGSGLWVYALDATTQAYAASGSVASDGTYAIRGLAAGTYIVQFGGAGYVTEYYDDAAYANATRLTLADGEQRPGIDAALGRAGTISGRVTDARTGAPVASAQVHVHDATSTRLYYTGSDGRYTASALPPGTYRVGFFASSQRYVPRYYDDAATFEAATELTLSSGGSLTGIDAALPRGASISGRVTDADTGDPVAGLSVYASNADTSSYGASAVTDGNGEYELIGLAAADYRVRFSSSSGANFIATYYNGKTSADADRVTVTADAPTTGIDQQVHAGGRILGTVVDAETGDPVAGASASASTFIDGEYYSGYATAGADGRFSVTGLPTGTHSLYVSAPYDSYYLSSGDSTSVVVTAKQDTTVADTALAVGGRVTGTVRDLQTGDGIQSAYANLTEVTGGGSGYGYTSSDGTYTTSAVAPGTYRVRFSGPSGTSYREQYYDEQTDPSAADQITVTARATTAGIDARLTPPPVSTTLPTVAGTPRQGQTLTSTAGVWAYDPTSVTRQWLRCDAADDYCWEISGATAATYTLGEQDADYRVAVRESARNLGGSTQARSALTDVVIALAPVNTSAPTIYGLVRSGETVNASAGSWANAPASYAYQWQRCSSFGFACEDLSGATESSYAIVDDDVGSRLVVVVTASNSGGAGEPVASSPSSIVVRAVPSPTTAPIVTGEAKQGETLSTTTGQWNGAVTYAYSWQRCDTAGANCVTIGATGASYEQRGADVGKRIRVAVRATNEGGTSDPSYSAATDTVVASRPVLVSGGSPSISGTAKVGETLHGYQGSWRNEPTSYEYSWLACPESGPCEAITGATTTTFVPTEEEIDDTIAFRVVAANPAGSSAPATSTQTAPVLPRVPSILTRPSIGGTPVEGQTLTLQRGTWTNDPTAYEQQWYRCDDGGACAVIDGATGETYVPVADDVDQRVVVWERASNAAGAGAWATSEPVRITHGPPANIGPPTIDGTAVEDERLSADSGAWSNAPTSYAYQWLRCTGTDTCTDIEDATGRTYDVSHADVGSTLAVDVTATNSGGSGGPERSAPTATVIEAGAPDTGVGNPPGGRPAEFVSSSTQSISFTSTRPGSTFECRLGNDAFESCTSPKLYSGLAEGEYTFSVRATDAQNRTDGTPASATWTVDRSAPDTTITGGPTAPVHDAASFTFTADELATFGCALDNGAYRACDSGESIDLDGLSPGTHTFRVRATDRAGNIEPYGATGTLTFANEAPTTTLGVTPDAGPADLEIEAVIGGSDGDGDPLAYKLDFGDGQVRTGGLPQVPITHDYEDTGVYLVRLEVDDGHERSVVTRQVTVVLAEPLRANAGDDLIAVAGEAVRLDGRGSRPTAGIQSSSWSFGDGNGANGAQASHTYAAPGTYEATLTVTAGAQSDSDTARVLVVAAEGAEGLGVTVTSGGGPVADTDVLVITADGRRVSGQSDSAGRTRLRGLADGTYTVFAYASGYLPKSVAATISHNAGAIAIDLTPGNVAEATLTHRRLTRDEIVALGIDPNDPSNQIVWAINVHLNDGDSRIYAYGDRLWGPGCSAGGCTFGGGSGRTYVSFHGGGGGGGGEGAPMVSTFTLPFTARWLKEFFAVEMKIYNLGSPGFVLRDGRARLALPNGLSLAPTARGEQLAKPVGDIAGGEYKAVDWIIRGDTAGEYDLSADYAGILDPIGTSIAVQAKTGTPLKVWGADAIEPIIETDEEHRDGYPMQVRMGLRNVSDIPIYDAAAKLSPGGDGYLDQPRQQLEHGVQEIPAGTTAWLGPWIIVPDADGAIDVARSFATDARGDRIRSFGVRTKPRVPALDDTPELKSRHLRDAIELDWDPVPGATGYEVYMIADRETPFDAEPVQVDAIDATRVAINSVPQEGEEPYYAVSAIIDGRHTMVHPLVAAPPLPPVSEGDEDPFGAPQPSCAGSSGTPTLSIGSAELKAACFTKNGDVYTAVGYVRVNGIDLFPQGSKITVDVGRGRISADRVHLKLGALVLYDGKLDWSPQLETKLAIPKGTKIRKLSIDGEMTIKIAPTRAELSGFVELPYARSGVRGELKLVASNEDGPQVDAFEVKVSGIALPGRIGVNGGLLKYKRTGAGDEWTGGASIAIPRGFATMTLAGQLDPARRQVQERACGRERHQPAHHARGLPAEAQRRYLARPARAPRRHRHQRRAVVRGDLAARGQRGRRPLLRRSAALLRQGRGQGAQCDRQHRLCHL